MHAKYFIQRMNGVDCCGSTVVVPCPIMYKWLWIVIVLYTSIVSGPRTQCVQIINEDLSVPMTRYTATGGVGGWKVYLVPFLNMCIRFL